jgi:hypothetical protein
LINSNIDLINTLFWHKWITHTSKIVYVNFETEWLVISLFISKLVSHQLEWLDSSSDRAYCLDKDEPLFIGEVGL